MLFQLLVLFLFSIHVHCNREEERSLSFLGENSIEDIRKLSERLKVLENNPDEISISVIRDEIDYALSRSKIQVVVEKKYESFDESFGHDHSIGLLGLWCSKELIDFIPLHSTGLSVTLTFNLTHIRCPLIMKYINKKDEVLESSSIHLSDWTDDKYFKLPYHARIAYGPEPQTQMWISWTMDLNTTKPFVKLGTSSNVYYKTIIGEGYGTCGRCPEMSSF